MLIARDKANQTLVKKALEILPEKAAIELADDDLAEWVVVRVNDDITVDLMTAACGVSYEDCQGMIDRVEIDGVWIPFANAELMLKMKQGWRGKDIEDRTFLQALIRRQRTNQDEGRPSET